jgi:hypothetical protein
LHANFERVVVDAFVFHKHCKFCGCTNLATRPTMASSSRLATIWRFIMIELMTKTKHYLEIARIII